MKIQKKKWEIGILVFVMVVSLINMIVYGCRKEGYHVDEVYSYGLANSEYLPFMHFGESGYDVKDWMLEYGAGESFADIFRNLKKDYKILQECDFQIYNSDIYKKYLIAQANSADTRTTTWVSGDDYRYYVGVSPENTFNYASVYYNQRGDVHPPFFYMLLHTVCSIFQGSFSKWYGLAINMVFMLMTLLVLYRMCDKFLGGKLPALCTTAVYGLSCGYVTTAVYIRMYAILTFMVVCSCYLHLQLSECDFELNKKRFWKLATVTFLGFYTHYYFVLYAIAMAVVACIWMFCKKYYKKMLAYILTMAATGAVGVCIWPFAIKHVFHGYRGMGAVSASLSGGAYWLKTKLILNQIWPRVAGGYWWLVALVAVLSLVVLLVWKRKEATIGKVLMLGAPIMFYVFATSQIVPFYEDRYVMCSFPFWSILLATGMYHSVKCIGEKLHYGKWQVVVVACTVMLVLVSNCYTNGVGYLYPGSQETVTLPENTDCVYVLPDGDWNESAGDSTILAQCRRVGIAYESNLLQLQSGYECEEGDYLLVCIQKGMDIENVLTKVHDTLGTEDMQECSRTYGGSAVRILFVK